MKTRLNYLILLLFLPMAVGHSHTADEACSTYKKYLLAEAAGSGLEVKGERGSGRSSYAFEYQCELELRSDDGTTLKLWIARDGLTADSMYNDVLAQIEKAKSKLEKGWFSSTYHSQLDQYRFNTSDEVVEILTKDRDVHVKRETIRRFAYGLVYVTRGTIDKDAVNDWAVDYDPRVQSIFDRIH